MTLRLKNFGILMLYASDTSSLTSEVGISRYKIIPREKLVSGGLPFLLFLTVSLIVFGQVWVWLHRVFLAGGVAATAAATIAFVSNSTASSASLVELTCLFANPVMI